MIQADDAQTVTFRLPDYSTPASATPVTFDIATIRAGWELVDIRCFQITSAGSVGSLIGYLYSVDEGGKESYLSLLHSSNYGPALSSPIRFRTGTKLVAKFHSKLSSSITWADCHITLVWRPIA